MRKTLAGVFVAGLLAVLSTGTAWADGPPSSNTTTHVVNATFNADRNPCTGAPTTGTETVDGVLHLTTFSDGRVDGTAEFSGTFSLTNGTSGTARTSLGFQGYPGAGEGQLTANGQGTNPDGSTFAFNIHGHFTTIDPLVNGTLAIDASTINCRAT